MRFKWEEWLRRGMMEKWKGESEEWIFEVYVIIDYPQNNINYYYLL